jgi:hypothetical protein
VLKQENSSLDRKIYYFSTFSVLPNPLLVFKHSSAVYSNPFLFILLGSIAIAQTTKALVTQDMFSQILLLKAPKKCNNMETCHFSFE